jgi:membrane protein
MFAGAVVVLAVVSLAASLTAGPLAPVLGLGVGYVVFYAVYRYIPRSRVRPGTARLAALVSAVLWEVAKVAFGFFTRSLGIFSAYGPIAFAAAMLTWIYVTAVIILIGAEVIKLKRA